MPKGDRKSKKLKLKIMTPEQADGRRKAISCMKEAKRREEEKGKKLMKGLEQGREPMDITREVLGDKVADRVEALLDKIVISADMVEELNKLIN